MRAAFRRRPLLVHKIATTLDRKYCDDFHVVRIDNHDFVFINEIQKTLPLWINLHQGFGDSYHVDPAPSYPRADTHIEIYVARPRCAAWVN